MSSILRLSALLMLIQVWSLQAQETPKYKQLLEMDLGAMLEVEVATGTGKQLSEVPAVVSVITSDDIKAMGARTLSEAVERIPGLHVAKSVNRLGSMFSVRGIQNDGTPQILVLLDGVELSELSALSMPYAFRYSVNFIERIEVIRGPGSAIYGADAFSGVVNVITKTPENNNSIETGVNIGSFDYVEGWLNGNLALENLNIGLSVTSEKTNNDNGRVTPYGVLSRERETDNIHLNLKAGQFHLKSWYWKTTQQMGVGAGIIGNNIDRDMTESYKSQLSWNGELGESIESAFDVSFSQSNFDAEFQLFPPGIWPVGADGNVFQPPFTPVNFPDGVIGRPNGKSKKTKLNGAVIYTGLADHRIRLGFGGEQSRFFDIGESKNFGPGILDEANIPSDLVSPDIIDVSGTAFAYTPEYQRDLWYLSVQDEWKFATDWELTLGLRFDDYTDFGATTNPRLALVWNSSDSITTKLLYGSAFRAPRAAELVFINNPTTLGNPELDPEKIKTIELAIDYRPTEHFVALLNIFSYKAEDLIQLDLSFTHQNSGEQEGHGIEVEANWQASDTLRINANVSWLDTRLPLIDAEKERVPGMMGFLELQYRLHPQWLLTTQNYWIKDRQRAPGDTRPDVDDYVKTDVNLIWQTESAWQMSVGIKNVFDEDIVAPVPNSALFALGLGFPDDYPLESRSIFGTISYRF